jgi:hypothetical protein
VPKFKSPFIGPDHRSYPAASPDAIVDYEYVKLRAAALRLDSTDYKIDAQLLDHLAGWVNRLSVENTRLRYENATLQERADKLKDFVSAWGEFGAKAWEHVKELD